MERVDDKIILKGVLQHGDRLNRNDGRIYHAEAYEKLIKRLVPDERIRKINSLRKLWR
jgi:hypothetical protein